MGRCSSRIPGQGRGDAGGHMQADTKFGNIRRNPTCAVSSGGCKRAHEPPQEVSSSGICSTNACLPVPNTTLAASWLCQTAPRLKTTGAGHSQTACSIPCQIRWNCLKIPGHPGYDQGHAGEGTEQKKRAWYGGRMLSSQFQPALGFDGSLSQPPAMVIWHVLET